MPCISCSAPYRACLSFQAGAYTIMCLIHKLACAILVFSVLVSRSLSAHSYHRRPPLDTVGPFHPLKNGTRLLSANGGFELGFFTLGRSGNQYLCIRYGGQVMWVANRRKPLPGNATGLLMVDSVKRQGALVLADARTGAVFWTSGRPAANVSTMASAVNISSFNSQPAATLQNDGNLVLRNGWRVLWQSFDYPTDTFLPGMRIGWDVRTGSRWFLTSWKSDDDPSPGDYTYSLDNLALPQLFVRDRHGSPKSSLGYWNGEFLSGLGKAYPEEGVLIDFVSDADRAYYSVQMAPGKNLSVTKMLPTGQLQRIIWRGDATGWLNVYKWPVFKCNNYSVCGADGVCDNQQPCACLPGFNPSSTGCVRAAPLVCGGDGDGFDKLTAVKLPDLTGAWSNLSMTPQQCRDACLVNCSCVAYGVPNIANSSGCVMWTGLLKDIQHFPSGGQEFFVRRALPSTSDKPAKKKKSSLKISIIIVAVCLGILLLVAGIVFILWKRKTSKTSAKVTKALSEDVDKWEEEVPLFSLSTIATATNNFAISNKIGQGGFGPVYKGILDSGKEVAVKRLSMTSRQGLNEFMNEVKLIARLQHRNLVGLLGCCIEGEERILVYEYMKNKSLDALIFGKQKGESLDWEKRVDIIQGVARGLLYLHEDSRLKVVHRDLKSSNVLLDESMNPKISDFGTARIFEVDQKEENTRRVIGTIGYISPEYAIEGTFSVKSDVYSFGVVLLEVISGIRNMKSRYIDDKEENVQTLLDQAWGLWQEGKILDLLDSTLIGACSSSKVTRYAQIGLLCVQESPADRPTMSQVVQMLGNDDFELAQPMKPGVLSGKKHILRDPSQSSTTGKESVVMVTMTEMEGR